MTDVFGLPATNKHVWG